MKLSFAFTTLVSLMTPILAQERRLGRGRGKGKGCQQEDQAWRFDKSTQINKWINEFEISDPLAAGLPSPSKMFVLTTLIQKDVVLFDGDRFPATEALVALGNSSNFEALAPDACAEGATGFLGYNGDFTETICSVHKKLIEFWAQSPDLQSKNVTGESDLVVDVKGVHGSLLEEPNVIPVLQAISGATPNEIGNLQFLLGTFVPRGYDNELLTIRKAKFWNVEECISEDGSGIAINTNPIIMWGDGDLENLKARRLDANIAVQANHARLFAEYLWKTYIFPTPFECPPPEEPETTINEDQIALVEGDDTLEAMKFFAMQAYFVAHNRGLDWNAGLLKERGKTPTIKSSVFNVGFCEYAKVLNDRYRATNVCAMMFAAQEAVYHGDEIRLFDLWDDIEENFRLILEVNPSVCDVKACDSLFY